MERERVERRGVGLRQPPHFLCNDCKLRTGGAAGLIGIGGITSTRERDTGCHIDGTTTAQIGSAAADGHIHLIVIEVGNRLFA